MREVIVRVTCDYCEGAMEENSPTGTFTIGGKTYEVDPCPSCLADLVGGMRQVTKPGEFSCAKCGKTYVRETSRDKHQEGCTK